MPPSYTFSKSFYRQCSVCYSEYKSQEMITRVLRVIEKFVTSFSVKILLLIHREQSNCYEREVSTIDSIGRIDL